MARIRSIKPELRTSMIVSSWPREVRYFFVLLWGYLDDYGRGVDDELLIASDCFPRDRDATPEVVDGWLETIAESGPVCRYEVDGRRYLHAPNWREHQKPSHPTRSKIPPCPEDEPDDFKWWREAHPQRLRDRSRKSRETLAKIPNTPPGPSQSPSGGLSETPNFEHGHVESATGDEPGAEADQSDETAVHAWYDDAPENLPNSSGTPPEHFVPEQGSKGAREQGSKGEGGVGGSGQRDLQTRTTSPANRPDGRTQLHELPDDFAITDVERRWAHSTHPGLDIDFETDQFIRYWRSEGRRKRNWHDAWQKWIADSAKRASERQLRRAPSNVVDLASGQPLPGADTNLAGWAAVAASFDSEDSA